jgi:predicted RNA-binding Zn-ribbon protein involved in translation (DUF1610 family)
MAPMICPQCAAQGLQSCVYVGYGSTTLLYCQPYYDTAGRYHIHDSNTTTQYFSCSNGHQWSQVAARQPCPTCGDAW